MNYDWIKQQILTGDYTGAAERILAQHKEDVLEATGRSQQLRYALAAIAKHGDGLARVIAELALEEER